MQNKTYRNLLKVLFDVVGKEATEHADCGKCSSLSPYFSCSRARFHLGMHIATGGDKDIYEMWHEDGKIRTSEDNGAILRIIQAIYEIVYDEEKRGCPSQYTGYICCRTRGHKGLHVAISDDVLAAWDDVVGGPR